MSLEQATPNRSPTNHPSSKLHSSQAAITAHFLVAIDTLFGRFRFAAVFGNTHGNDRGLIEVRQNDLVQSFESAVGVEARRGNWFGRFALEGQTYAANKVIGPVGQSPFGFVGPAFAVGLTR